MAIFSETTEKGCVKENCPLESENSTCSHCAAISATAELLFITPKQLVQNMHKHAR